MRAHRGLAWTLDCICYGMTQTTGSPDYGDCRTASGTLSGRGQDEVHGEGRKDNIFSSREDSAFSLTGIVPARYDAAAYRIDALSY